MNVFETVDVQVPTSDVERKDFKITIIMAGLTLLALIIINL